MIATCLDRCLSFLCCKRGDVTDPLRRGLAAPGILAELFAPTPVQPNGGALVFSRAYLSLLCISSVFLCLPTARCTRGDDKAPAPDLTGFPRLTGKLEQLLGHERGFIRPRPGEPFQLDLANLAKVEQLHFDPKRKSYIPLPGPLAVESIRYYSNGAFMNMRLVSPDKLGSRVLMDIVPQPGRGPNRVLVWVVIETNVMSGVALIECEADGEFPSRRK